MFPVNEGVFKSLVGGKEEILCVTKAVHTFPSVCPPLDLYHQINFSAVTPIIQVLPNEIENLTSECTTA